MTDIDAGAAPLRPAGLKVGVVANLVGRAWPALLGIAAVPLYLEWIGVEAYALVGAFAVLQVASSVLDMGLSTTLTRQLARAVAGERSAQQARTLVRSLEVPYWAAALLVALLSTVVAGPLAAGWLNPDALADASVRRAATLMGLTAAAQFPFALYTGGLLGLHRQVLVNAVTVTAATLRVGGTLLVLRFVSGTIEAFFVSQLAASVLQTAAGRVALWACLPRAQGRASFDARVLAGNVRFAGGVAAISVTSLLLTQGDKVVLSNALPLRDFGYYTLAATVAGATGLVAMPVFAALFPRLSAIALRADTHMEAREYHAAAQVLAVLVLPLGAALAWFSREALGAWTGKQDVAQHAHLATTLLVAGSALNALMHVPYAAQLAHGWTRLPLLTNCVSVAVLAPALLWAATRYGAAGAASVWVALNAGYVLVAVQVMHRRVLRGELLRWYGQDIGLPLLGALGGVALADALLPAAEGRVATLARVGAAFAVACSASALLAPATRGWLSARLLRRREARTDAVP